MFEKLKERLREKNKSRVRDSKNENYNKKKQDWGDVSSSKKKSQ